MMQLFARISSGLLDFSIWMTGDNVKSAPSCTYTVMLLICKVGPASETFHACPIFHL